MMKRPDLLVCHIKHCDYPIFRGWLRKHRDFFGKIVIYWSEHFRHMYYDKFIQEDLSDLKDIVFLQNIEYKYGVEDWRNIATNYMLKETVSQWVCSVEQDFFTTDWDKLLKSVEEASKTYDILGYMGRDHQQEYQGYLKGHYVHPAFWFIKRSLLEKTSKDFGAKPDEGYDHFGRITRDVMKLNVPIWWTQENGFPEETTFHQGGINFNYLEGLKPDFKFHRPDLFYIYNWWGMKAKVKQSPEFMELMRKIDGILKLQNPSINPETDSRAIFYK